MDAQHRSTAASEHINKGTVGTRTCGTARVSEKQAHKTRSRSRTPRHTRAAIPTRTLELGVPGRPVCGERGVDGGNNGADDRGTLQRGQAAEAAPRARTHTRTSHTHGDTHGTHNTHTHTLSLTKRSTKTVTHTPYLVVRDVVDDVSFAWTAEKVSTAADNCFVETLLEPEAEPARTHGAHSEGNEEGRGRGIEAGSPRGCGAHNVARFLAPH